MNQLESGPFGQFPTHLQIPIDSIFEPKYLREKGYFPDNTVRVRKGVAWCLLCAKVDVASIIHAEKIPSE